VLHAAASVQAGATGVFSRSAVEAHGLLGLVRTKKRTFGNKSDCAASLLPFALCSANSVGFPFISMTYLACCSKLEKEK
jgi:hypothetical protein